VLSFKSVILLSIREVKKMAVGAGAFGGAFGGGGCLCGIAIVVVIILLLIAMGIVF
jgi:hypothetical protein